MRRAALLVGIAYFALVALLVVWATWLLATDDPDGGRHPVGAVILVVAVILGTVGAVSARRGRRSG